ncbi:rare lipoprotein A [Bradyrhizobium canariense]|uniref:Rare lipoprotein A n=1 Tax=Bradyrhizobium canariense TaxID=255045 RepID=A0A1H1MU26_9BRAD|nr:rare lipoprotein A [Bradyrhizobium canariense]
MHSHYVRATLARISPPGFQGTFSEPKRYPINCSRQGRFVYRSVLTIFVALTAASACEAETGLASYYGGRGHRGEMTCAHRTRPFGSIVTVTHAGQSIRCRVNDRGPFIRGRVIDVSLSAARALGMTRSGIVRVSVE